MAHKQNNHKILSKNKKNLQWTTNRDKSIVLDQVFKEGVPHE